MDECYITVNKNAIPNDPQKPALTSGVRIGTPAVTTRGLKEDDMRVIGECIYLTAKDFESNKEKVRAWSTSSARSIRSTSNLIFCSPLPGGRGGLKEIRLAKAINKLNDEEKIQMTTVKNTEVLYQNYNSVAPLGLICMNGTQELGAKINSYLERWQTVTACPTTIT